MVWNDLISDSSSHSRVDHNRCSIPCWMVVLNSVLCVILSSGSNAPKGLLFAVDLVCGFLYFGFAYFHVDEVERSGKRMEKGGEHLGKIWQAK